MSFRDRPIAQRWKAMGDEAEAVFERVYEQVVGQKFVRFGFDRAPINVARLSTHVRYSPDYCTARGLVEVQGFGSDQTFKLKLDKLDALVEWSNYDDVHVFIYDSKFDEYAWCRLFELKLALQRHADVRSFPEGKRYYALPKALLPTTEEGWRTAPCNDNAAAS